MSELRGLLGIKDIIQFLGNSWGSTNRGAGHPAGGTVEKGQASSPCCLPPL